MKTASIQKKGKNEKVFKNFKDESVDNYHYYY